MRLHELMTKAWCVCGTTLAVTITFIIASTGLKLVVRILSSMFGGPVQ